MPLSDKYVIKATTRESNLARYAMDGFVYQPLDTDSGYKLLLFDSFEEASDIAKATAYRSGYLLEAVPATERIMRSFHNTAEESFMRSNMQKPVSDVEATLRAFDFKKVQRVMSVLPDGECRGKNAPRVEQLEKKARELLEMATDQSQRWGEGLEHRWDGFCARRKGDELFLTFEIESSRGRPLWPCGQSAGMRER